LWLSLGFWFVSVCEYITFCPTKQNKIAINFFVFEKKGFLARGASGPVKRCVAERDSAYHCTPESSVGSVFQLFETVTTEMDQFPNEKNHPSRFGFLSNQKNLIGFLFEQIKLLST